MRQPVAPTATERQDALLVRPGPCHIDDVLADVPFSKRTIGNLLLARAASYPDHPILQVAGDDMTWGQLAEQAQTLAGSLAALGVRKGDVVCQMAGNTVDHVVALFASALLGSVECPINTGLRGQPLRHVLSHSGARVLLVQEAFVDRVVGALDETDAIPTVVVRGGPLPNLGQRAVLDAASLPTGPFEPAAADPEDPAHILYTSGTTGPAKGVLLPHHFTFAAAAVKIGVWGLGTDDVLFNSLPLFHSNARYSSLLTACVLNARAVIVDRFSASAFWEQVRSSGATEIGTVGTVAPILLERAPGPGDRDHRVKMMHGAGALPPEARVRFEERFGIKLVNGFAMTETSHFSTTSPDDPGRSRAAGRPVESFEVAILDDNDVPLEPGQVGEITVRPRGPYSMLLGYHHDPAATLQAFRNLWFHTGDLGLLDADGYLHWADRKKDAIRRKGEMISSRDVEEAALGYGPAAEVAAVGVPGDLGEEEVKLFVRAREGEHVGLDALLAHCRATLPDFAVPRYYEVLAEFPRNASQKVEKAVLRKTGLTPTTWDALAGQRR